MPTTITWVVLALWGVLLLLAQVWMQLRVVATSFNLMRDIEDLEAQLSPYPNTVVSRIEDGSASASSSPTPADATKAEGEEGGGDKKEEQQEQRRPVSIWSLYEAAWQQGLAALRGTVWDPELEWITKVEAQQKVAAATAASKKKKKQEGQRKQVKPAAAGDVSQPSLGVPSSSCFAPSGNSRQGTVANWVDQSLHVQSKKKSKAVQATLDVMRASEAYHHFMAWSAYQKGFIDCMTQRNDTMLYNFL